MSRANTEVVRRLYDEGALDGRFDLLSGVVDPEVVYVNPPDAGDSGTRRGIGEVVTALEALRRSFVTSRHELHDLVDAGDAVVARVTFHAQGRDSGAQLTQEEAHTWTFRDGRIVSFEWGRDIRAALAAVGLSQ
jgi:ketosteroid isomerase-like protein